MKRVCIQSPSGRFNYFRDSAKDAIDAFLGKKNFSDVWPQFERAGYKVVQVDIRIVKELKA